MSVSQSWEDVDPDASWFEAQRCDCQKADLLLRSFRKQMSDFWAEAQEAQSVLDQLRQTLDSIEKLAKDAPIRYLRGVCESPIEIEMGLALLNTCPSDYRVYPQMEFQRFRMDFGIVRNGDGVSAFVECDGRQWHSTPAQLENDRLKNEAAKREGIKMIRFKGGEIFRDAIYCAKVVWAGLK